MHKKSKIYDIKMRFLVPESNSWGATAFFRKVAIC